MLKRRVIDTHCDTLMYYTKDYSVFKDGGIDVTYEKMGGYDTYLGTFAMYFDATLEQAERLTIAEKYLAAFAHMLASYDIKRVLTSADLKELTGRGALLSIENACFFEDDEADLAKYWAAGVRILSMTHFLDSQFGCGNAAGDTPDRDTGLTKRGRAFVPMVEKCGMVLDVSHLSFKSFWDVCEVASKPFIATHSNAYAKRGHNRNLKDDMFLEIVRRGGLSGLCFCPAFISDSEDETAQIDELVDHAEHMLSLGGEKTICIGGDFDGIDHHVTGLENCSLTWNLAETMLHRGWSESLVEDIMWGNAYRFLMKMLPEV